MIQHLRLRLRCGYTMGPIRIRGERHRPGRCRRSRLRLQQLSSNACLAAVCWQHHQKVLVCLRDSCSKVVIPDHSDPRHQKNDTGFSWGKFQVCLGFTSGCFSFFGLGENEPHNSQPSTSVFSQGMMSTCVNHPGDVAFCGFHTFLLIPREASLAAQCPSSMAQIPMIIIVITTYHYLSLSFISYSCCFFLICFF